MRFDDNTFDCCTCVNSLSYVDLTATINEVKRVLKNNGTFIMIDSFNHNIIYRLNRYFHYLKGHRSLSTIKRIPDSRTIRYLEQGFDKVDVQYFGIFVFIIPLLKMFLSEEKISIIIDRLDKKFSFLNRYAFKIVVIATQNPT
ncbi:MAG: class I SAM-dependent methyltransferase [Bacteroidales bacterium]|nr:class I SAM-dependent methyltransferase [Bacteroidales bacterium]